MSEGPGPVHGTGDPTTDEPVPEPTATESDVGHPTDPQLPGAVRYGTLTWVPYRTRPELLAEPVHAMLEALDLDVAKYVYVAEIDPELADTAAMTEEYGVPLAASSNCVVVAGKRAGEERVAACVVRATTRADVNTSVRKLLDVRKASFWPTDRAVEASGMEYGGITPIGLPPEWRLLLDERVASGPSIIGSGVRRSKLLLPGGVLTALPGAEVVEGLGHPVG